VTHARAHTEPERLSAWLDGEIRGATARQIEAHLESCHTCRGIVDDLRAIRLAAVGLREGRAVRSGWEQVAERLADADAVRARFPWPAMAAAALLLLSLGIRWLVLPGASPSVSLSLSGCAASGAGHLALSLLASSAAVLLAAWLVPGIRLRGLRAALGAVALFSVANLLLRSVVAVVLPIFIVKTAAFGLFAVPLNAVLLLVASHRLRGLEVQGLRPALRGGFLIALASVVALAL